MSPRFGKSGVSRDGGGRLSELEFKRPAFVERSKRQVTSKEDEAEELGKRHGRVGTPSRDDDQADAVSAYNNEGENNIGAISHYWRDVNRTLHGEWCRLRHLIEGRKVQVPAAKSAVKGAQKRVDEKRKLYEKQLEAARSAKPGTRHRIGKIPYILGLIAVFLVDVPLNAAVFQIFGENQLATWALAGLLGILVVPAAHVLGTQTRNGFPDRVITIASAVVPLLLIAAIAVLRTKYLQVSGVQLNGALGVLLFLVFNLAVFAAAVFLSYLRHDPYQQAIEEAEGELARAQPELAAAKETLLYLENEIAEMNARAAEIHAWGEEELRKATRWAESERDYYQKLIFLYVAENKAQRPNDVVPALEHARNKKPSIPPDLARDAELRWTCDGDVVEEAAVTA